MREEFEAWSANHEYLGGVEIDRAISGNYSDVDLHHAWEAWQASRKALVIALPREVSLRSPTEVRDMIKHHIESHGLKVAK